MPKFRPIALVVVVLMATAAAAHAQYDMDLDGAETCRHIWREFGRSMNGHPRAVYCEVRDVGTFKPASTIEVDGTDKNGVTVRGDTRADAKVRLVVQAQGRTVDDARALAQKVTIDLGGKPLRVSGIDRRDQGDNELHFVAATIVIDAPEKADLWLRVNYAPLEVEGVTGRMDLLAAYGPLTLRDAGGDVRARVEHGPLTVELSQSKWDGAGLDAEAEYGPMTLRVPRDFSAQLEIGARHGPLDVDFPLTLSRLGGSTIQTKLGSGGPKVRAVADYGPMSLQMSREN
ncbi:MAG TPA: hypothetical protein VJ867_03150 [Gemmatimonadaceae bacterium]|nr:hypothetical protein [Gemmatimonadaceae bacterium]